LPGEAFVRYALRGNARERSRRRCLSLSRAARRTLSRDDQSRRCSPRMVAQIAQVDSHYVLGGMNWLGRSEPMHATALGKVLLAFGAADVPSGRLERLTPRTITTRPRWNLNCPRSVGVVTRSPPRSSNPGSSPWRRRCVVTRASSSRPSRSRDPRHDLMPLGSATWAPSAWPRRTPSPKRSATSQREGVRREPRGTAEGDVRIDADG